MPISARILHASLIATALVLTSCGGAPAQRTDDERPGRTEASAGPLLRFAVVGDQGSGNENQHAVAARMCRRMERRPISFVVTTGDNVYPDGDPDLFPATFYEPYRCLLDAGVKFHASLGNHDIRTRNGRPEIEEPAFGMPARRYVLRRAGVRFVVEDSNNLKRDWLRRKLTAEDGDIWTVVVFHHPVYSAGATYGESEEFIPRLPRMFARKGVDLALHGHDHLYSATKPLRGIRYVVSGGGGAYLRSCAEKWFAAACFSRYHFVEVTVHADRMVIRAIPARGKILHRFQIER